MSTSYLVVRPEDKSSQGRIQSGFQDYPRNWLNAEVVSVSPAMAMGISYLTTAHATSIMVLNAARQQQYDHILEGAHFVKKTIHPD